METNFNTLHKVSQHGFAQNYADNFQPNGDESIAKPQYERDESALEKTGATESALYIPHWVTGGAKPPGLIVETPGLTNVAPPTVTYRPNLPKNLSEKGIISTFQFGRVIYAGQAHGQRLANGARSGISIGDDTGTGKTLTLAGIILDNWFCGTLFLDEIGEITLTVQAKLLKAVEEKRIRRVGSNAERIVDTRIGAATSQNLEEMTQKECFRADLYDRLNILNLETVPLRFQKEKIKDLLVNGLERECAAIGRILTFEISAETIRLIEAQDWHGNFRQLNNFAARLAVECLDDATISSDSVRRILGEKSNTTVLAEAAESAQMANNIIHHNFQPFSDNLITVSFDTKTDNLDTIYLKAAGNVIRHVLSPTRRSASISTS